MLKITHNLDDKNLHRAIYSRVRERLGHEIGVIGDEVVQYIKITSGVDPLATKAELPDDLSVKIAIAPNDVKKANEKDLKNRVRALIRSKLKKLTK